MFYLQFANMDPGMMKEISTNLYVEMIEFQSLVCMWFEFAESLCTCYVWLPQG